MYLEHPILQTYEIRITVLGIVALSLFSEVEVIFKSILTEFPANDRYFILILHATVSLSPSPQKEKSLSFLCESGRQAG